MILYMKIHILNVYNDHLSSVQCTDSLFVCLFVWGFSSHLRNVFIWRRCHYRWRPANFDLCWTFIAIEQWRIFQVPHLLHVTPLRGDTHTLLPSVWQWICRNLFLRIRFVEAGIRVLISRMRGECSTTTPSRRLDSQWRSAVTAFLGVIVWLIFCPMTMRPFFDTNWRIHVGEKYISTYQLFTKRFICEVQLDQLDNRSLS